MKLKLKKCSLLGIILLLLGLSANRVECLFLIPSMLMAMTMTGGLLMGKMSMAGLLMMLMAANNQQQNGQNFLRNLGLVPHPSPSTGISVPGTDAFVQDLIVRRRRDVGISNNTNLANDKLSHPQPGFSGVIDEITQYRVMRQVASSDPLGCLPSALCGLASAPPSSQSGFLNDYAYLLKTVFTRDDDLDDDLTEFDEFTTSGKKKKSKTKSSSTKKKDKKKKEPALNDDEDLQSSEEDDVEEEDIASQRRKEAIELSDMANEEMLTNNPDYIPYAIRDSLKIIGAGSHPLDPVEPPQPPENPYQMGDINHMSEAQLDDMLAQMGGPPPERPGSGSLLSKIMPKLSLGFTKKGDTKFDDDPFFAGFRRSMEGRKLQVDSASVRPATPEEEQLFEELRLKRRMRREYIALKRKELSEIKDPVEKFRIAAEFGHKLKSPRQCRALFNSCPFNYTQVLGMVADLRNVIMGQPINPPQADTVVNLKPAASASPSSSSDTGSKNVINLNAGTVSAGGVTSIIHQLPSGEKVEINLKMTKSGLTAATQKTKPKPSLTNSTATSSGLKNKNTNFKPGQISSSPNDSSGFENDEQDNQDENKSPSSPPPVHSIESLKATMMAIQKINNATIHRKKHAKPISYSHNIFSALTHSHNLDTNASSSTPISEDVKLPDPSPAVLTKLHVQNGRPSKKNSNNPQKTAALLATLPLSKTEDDEADDTLPTSLIGIKRITSTGPKSNQELAEILARLKETKKRIYNKQEKVAGSGGDISEEEEEDEQEYGDDEEEDEMDDLNKMYKSGLEHDKEESQGRNRDFKRRHRRPFPEHLMKRRGQIGYEHHRRPQPGSPLYRHVFRHHNNERKPKKLFLGHDINLIRPLPL